MSDSVLDILQTIGYNGVPSREDMESVKKIIEKAFRDGFYATTRSVLEIEK